MAGHLFVVHGDVLGIACDAALVPTDVDLHLRQAWMERLPTALRQQHAPGGQNQLLVDAPDDWCIDGNRSMPLPGWSSLDGSGQVWLTNTGDDENRGVDWIVNGAIQFLDRARESMVHKPAHRRARHLLAMPLVGSGHGGARHVKDLLQRALLPRLQSYLADADDLDVVLALQHVEDFAAAQRVRTRDGASVGATEWPTLAPELAEEARRLVVVARSGGLVLFVGAGASMGAGLPGWKDLLRRLADRAGIDAGDLEEFGFLDRAAVIQTHLERRSISWREAICEQFAADRHSLVQALLAGLPAQEAVTTNYDCLLEEAFRAAGQARVVLPWQYIERGQPWLLKLHGSTDHPDSLVLTRSDYLRYADSRGALRGLVQALLITREMVFVGFGLDDDNFARIVDDVRKAIRSDEEPRRPFGTALVVGRQPMLADLWEGDLRIVAMPGATTADQARQLEIFLDRVASEAHAGAEFVMRAEYAALLDDEERHLADRLRALEEEMDGLGAESRAWRIVEQAIEQLGGGGPKHVAAYGRSTRGSSS